ncbi:MAG TPA: spermidine synthase [Candidatus Krumholzibacteria bacterium]|nr:spermidine synthase [Candidatus Krumholzibacteria bacterium]
MSHPPLIEELDYQKTDLGELVLRRRRSPSVPGEMVYEVKIDDALLMSSTVNVSERALATLALDGRGGAPCDVLVGGLGLGYTAAAALEYANVGSVIVVELLAPVIDWQRRRLVPMAETLMRDPRCSLVLGDFFDYVVGGDAHRKRCDVVLLDIDHSPDSWLHARHGDFYTAAGLRGLTESLPAGGVFGLWSASKPADDFLALVNGAFPVVNLHEVSFLNPHLNETMSNWVVIAERR